MEISKKFLLSEHYIYETLGDGLTPVTTVWGRGKTVVLFTCWRVTLVASLEGLNVKRRT